MRGIGIVKLTGAISGVGVVFIIDPLGGLATYYIWYVRRYVKRENC